MLKRAIWFTYHDESLTDVNISKILTFALNLLRIHAEEPIFLCCQRAIKDAKNPAAIVG